MLPLFDPFRGDLGEARDEHGVSFYQDVLQLERR